ncbi:MAG: CoA transferase, partial [Chloroflexi bacterium]|nr:CoA transferase [Chloroflexota bacterium]
RSTYMAPHGSYRCAGDDRWLAITITNDEEWDALGRALGEPEWSKDPRFSTLIGRMEHQDELDAAIERLTCSQDAFALMHRMQEAGVPAGVVNKTSDLFTDPQLAHRHHFYTLDHTEMGPSAYDGPNFKMSKTPAQMRPAPCLGEHNDLVYREMIGLSEEEYTDCLIEGVFE